MREGFTETMVQDEKTCVIYGMPKEAVKMSAIDKITALENIAGLIEAYDKDKS